MALVMAWAAFWISTALFPCCEALAAVFDDHSNAISHSVAAEQTVHRVHESNSEQPHQHSDSPCGHVLDAGPEINGIYAGPPAHRVDSEWIAIVGPVATGLIKALRSETLARNEYHPPPPPFRFYLDTQRLLI